MDFKLSEEQELIQKAAREFAVRRLQPIADKIDRENLIPDEVLKELGELGMFGIPFLDEHSSGSAGYLTYILALEQLCRTSLGVGMIISVNTVGLAVISIFGTGEQKRRHLRECAEGKKIFSFAFTEPGTGSDPKQLTTTAAREGDEYILNGTKRFISNSGYSGPMVLIARESGTGNVTAFLVDKFCDGYSLSKPWEKIGAHGGPLYDVYLNNVRIPAANVVGRSGDGMLVLKTAMIYGKIGLAGMFLGTSRSAYEEAVSYAREKTHRGEPIASKFQHVQIAIAEMAMKYNAARWYACHLGWAADNRQDPTELAKEAALTKVFVAETAIDIVRTAMGIHGSYGVMRDYKVSQLWNDAIIGPQVEGTAPLLKVLAANIIINSRSPV
ncbi:MAG: acyl-CoA dehydrogenase [Firmicutes bacterium]|nr:acyl-CoA dehydrogenase [Bacillota bacterium]